MLVIKDTLRSYKHDLHQETEVNMEHKILNRYPIGNPRRKWTQDNFVLSQFKAHGNNMRRHVKACADVGFDTVELGWASDEQADAAVQLCEQFGLRLIYQNMSRFGGAWDRDPVSGNHGNYYAKIYQGLIEKGTWKESTFRGETDIRKVIAEKRRWNSVVGYYIWDEPFFEEQFLLCRKLTDDCESEDPSALAFTVANPSYNPYFRWDDIAFPAYIARFADIIDPPVLSFDHYPIRHDEEIGPCQLDNSPMWCDLAAVKRIAEERNIPFWFYYQGVNYRKVPLFTFPMVRLSMYAGAMYGAKALQHYCSTDAIVDSDGNRLPFFEPQKQINAEFKALGDTLMAIECKHVFHDASCLADFEPMKQYTEPLSDSAFLAGELPYRTSAGEFVDSYGNLYMMVLNRDFLCDKTVTLKLNKNYRIYEVSRDDGLQYVKNDCTDMLSLHLEAGDAALLRLQPAEDKAFTVEYRLVK